MRSILVVDDEPEMVELTKMLIQGTGSYDVVVASSGLEAYRKARSKSFHLVITDFRMPGWNGAVLIRTLRSQEPNAHTPILVTTAYLDEAKQECEALGIRRRIDYLTKPFRSATLLEEIERLALPEGASISPEARALDVDIPALFADTVAESLKMIGGLTGVRKTPAEQAELRGACVAVGVSLTAELFSANLSLILPEPVLATLARNVLGEVTHASSFPIELMNVVVDHLKLALVQRGYRVETASPMICSGSDLTISGHSPAQLSVMRIESDSGGLLVVAQVRMT